MADRDVCWWPNCRRSSTQLIERLLTSGWCEGMPYCDLHAHRLLAEHPETARHDPGLTQEAT